MAAFAQITSAREVDQKDSELISYPVATATTLYKGGLIALNSGGYATYLGPTADQPYVGIATETVVNGGANGAKSISVDPTGIHKLLAPDPFIAQGDVGKEVYANTAADGNNAQVVLVDPCVALHTHTVVGRVTEILGSGTEVMVSIRNYAVVKQSADGT